MIVDPSAGRKASWRRHSGRSLDTSSTRLPSSSGEREIPDGEAQLRERPLVPARDLVHARLGQPPAARRLVEALGGLRAGDHREAVGHDVEDGSPLGVRGAAARWLRGLRGIGRRAGARHGDHGGGRALREDGRGPRAVDAVAGVADEAGAADGAGPPHAARRRPASTVTREAPERRWHASVMAPAHRTRRTWKGPSPPQRRGSFRWVTGLPRARWPGRRSPSQEPPPFDRLVSPQADGRACATRPPPRSRAGGRGSRSSPGRRPPAAGGGRGRRGGPVDGSGSQSRR